MNYNPHTRRCFFLANLNSVCTMEIFGLLPSSSHLAIGREPVVSKNLIDA